VTPEERSRVLALVVAPGGPASLSEAEFLREFGSSDGGQLGLDLLHDAVRRQDSIDVELALIVCFKFGFSTKHLQLLTGLAFAEWHQRHQDVATALGKLGSPTAVEALVHLASWVPGYLSYDNGRALAVKAIWALGALTGEPARNALKELANSHSSAVARAALTQLQK